MRKVNLISLIIVFFLPSAHLSAEQIDVPFGEVWDRSIEKILDWEGIPSYRDKEIGIIRTEKFLMKLDMTTADCGTFLLIPYMKDKRVRNWVSYQIRLKNIDENTTDIRVSTIIDGYLFPLKSQLKKFDFNRTDFSEYQHFKEIWEDDLVLLNCKSTGELEKQFTASIRGE